MRHALGAPADRVHEAADHGERDADKDGQAERARLRRDDGCAAEGEAAAAAAAALAALCARGGRHRFVPAASRRCLRRPSSARAREPISRGAGARQAASSRVAAAAARALVHLAGGAGRATNRAAAAAAAAHAQAPPFHATGPRGPPHTCAKLAGTSGAGCPFCPVCANLLLVEECLGGTGLRLFCQTCPYVYDVDRKASAHLRSAPGARGAAEEAEKRQSPTNLRSGARRAGRQGLQRLRRRTRDVVHPPHAAQISVVVPTQRKQVDDVLGGDAAWANVDKTQGARA